MRENVASESVVITDAYVSYKGLEKHFNEHVSIKHTEGNYKTEGEKHTNNIEGFWSQLKRGVIGTYHYVSPQHLQRYCLEFETRYNQRDVSNIQRFIEVLKSSDKARIQYAELTTSHKQ